MGGSLKYILHLFKKKGEDPECHEHLRETLMIHPARR